MKLQTMKIPTQGLMYKQHFSHGSISGNDLLNKGNLDYSSFNSNNSNNSNILNKKTAKNVSFSGLPISEVSKVKNSKLWKFLNNKALEKFVGMADASQSIFDAAFALGITCFLRPAAIIVQPTKDPKTKEKNKKAASHSISSGIIGYGFAVAVYSPIKKAIDKIKKHPNFFAKKAAKFFKYADKGMNKTMSSSGRMQTFTMLCNYIPQVLTASIRSAITIAMIPVIDKYLLNRIFGKNQQETTKTEITKSPYYKYSVINFKNNLDTNKVFQNFTGVMK